MNLKKLFDMQEKLDEKILERFPHLRNEDLLPKKILALQVELGELCNCWRGFKFWSNDQKPRMEKEVFCTVCDGTGTPLGIPEESGVDCYQCNGAGFYFINPLLEEYVDCLHFLLSIGLESEIGTFTGDELIPIKMGTIEMQFIMLFKVTVTFLEDISYYQEMWELFLGLGEMLGFTWDEIEKAYLERNKINYE